MSRTFKICVSDKVVTLLPTFPVHFNRLNSISVSQMGLSQTCPRFYSKHLDVSRWFVSATFMICVHDFPRLEVSVKVGVKEFGLDTANTVEWTVITAVTYL